MRKPGISTCVCFKNNEQTLKACITSFMEFADEIIIVDNKSSDSSKQIATELAEKYDKVSFYDHPEIEHIYDNRQVALEHSHYKWIHRCDPDHVARDNIMELRKIILSQSTEEYPVVFRVTQINLRYDIHHYYPNPPPNEIGKILAVFMPRFYSYFKGIKFQSLGRYDGIYVPLTHKIITLETPYWFHCHFKADMDHFLRIGLSDWEGLGTVNPAIFKKFPSLESYMLHIAKTKYGTSDIKKACAIYMKKTFFSELKEYDPKKYFPYSSHIIKNFK